MRRQWVDTSLLNYGLPQPRRNVSGSCAAVRTRARVNQQDNNNKIYYSICTICTCRCCIRTHIYFMRRLEKSYIWSTFPSKYLFFFFLNLVESRRCAHIAAQYLYYVRQRPFDFSIIISTVLDTFPRNVIFTALTFLMNFFSPRGKTYYPKMLEIITKT
jgi:hypothetical protein